MVWKDELYKSMGKPWEQRQEAILAMAENPSFAPTDDVRSFIGEVLTVGYDKDGADFFTENLHGKRVKRYSLELPVVALYMQGMDMIIGGEQPVADSETAFASAE